ncbi:MAG: EAL domain-containing protein [Mobilitalea sp.]
MKEKFMVKRRNKHMVLALLMLLAIAIAVLVYMMGGTTKVYTHFMYIPIVIAASLYGKKEGLFIAVYSDILIGPFMPQNVEQQIPQQTVNWIIRMCIFGVVALIIGFFSDYNRKNQKRITTILTHNENTGLKNVEAIKNEDAIDGISKTIVVFSIKGIQDTMILFGYFFENKITCEISAMLSEILSKYKNAEIYQYYGMQFVLKISKEDGMAEDKRKEAELLINEIKDLDKSVMIVDNIPIYLEVRMGIVETEGDVSTYEGIRQAQIAYSYTQANELKESRFNGRLEEYYKNILDIAGGFSDAISNRKIGVAYQNIVSSKDGKVHSTELLARWKKEDGSYISPVLFIPIVEKTELIQELTKYMIIHAIEFLQKTEERNTTVSINFSKRDFENESIDFLLDSIEKSGVNPSCLQIEVIERNLTDVSNLNSHLERLRKHHVKIALDDFGTDYSSYQYLSELHLDTVKLDKSLIYNIHKRETSRRLVKSIVQFCEESGIKTVAEGVETKEIADTCREIGIDYLQGYYFHMPEMLN